MKSYARSGYQIQSTCTCIEMSTRSSLTNEIYMFVTDIFTSTLLWMSSLDIQKTEQTLGQELEDPDYIKLQPNVAYNILMGPARFRTQTYTWYSRDITFFFFLLIKNLDNCINRRMQDQTLPVVNFFFYVDVCCGDMILSCE